MLLNHRIVIDQPGGPEQLREEPVPVPQPHEALVRVRACGVAFGDIIYQRGALPGGPPSPLTPGYDLVGDVIAVGAAVTRVKPGDRVAALPVPGQGGYTTYICLPAAELIHLPTHLAPTEAVGAMLNYATAYRMLTRDARLRAGQRVLIHGAAGGVGTAVLQLARVLGLTAYGTASTGKQALVRAQGGIAIDYTTTDFVAEIAGLTGGAGVDAVLDGIGGPQLTRSYQCLNQTGTLVLFGVSSTLEGGGSPKRKMAASMLRFGLLKLRPNRKRVTMSFPSSKADLQALRTDAEAMLQLLAEGKIKPLITHVLPLSQAAEAHRLLTETRPVGKIVLEP
ncbi:medium chain dehydrogenase/reductase family protein [Hymenobacter ginsengisoli]|uniref:Medium chain dehydrogenase/reductase family protein n=1 Tax=Hymenobacter ginsengisoli TaxID=1051626 RepID=A0ABP8PW93_9BACT|nr:MULTISPECIES: zinc-binding dehydrogenase [unclassified Hymenobacter]MBO2033740.1 zinc-binding dehydrogenase [Hymenobacter sp. BT559]